MGQEEKHIKLKKKWLIILIASFISHFFSAWAPKVIHTKSLNHPFTLIQVLSSTPKCFLSNITTVMRIYAFSILLVDTWETPVVGTDWHRITELLISDSTSWATATLIPNEEMLKHQLYIQDNAQIEQRAKNTIELLKKSKPNKKQNCEQRILKHFEQLAGVKLVTDHSQHIKSYNSLNERK